MSEKNDHKPDVSLAPLQDDDREQFIKDNQWAFMYGAQIEFGMRDERTEEGTEVISRRTIERSIDGENAEAYRIVQDGKYVGGVVLTIDREAGKGELELCKPLARELRAQGYTTTQRHFTPRQVRTITQYLGTP